MREFYAGLPKEVRVFFEYILPSAVLASLVEYLEVLSLDNAVVMGLINIGLLFLRQLKPRLDARK